MQPNNLLDTNILIYQNPLIISYLIHSFLKRYAEENECCDIHLIYYIVPIVLVEDYYSVLSSTHSKSGLEKFLIKFIDSKKRDILLRLEYEANRYFKLTSHSIHIGDKCKLFSVHPKEAKIFFIESKEDPKVPQALTRRVKNAEKLGYWLSKHPSFAAISLLKMGGA